MPCPGPTFSGLALLLVGYHSIHSKISGRANELQKQSAFCFYQKSKPLASYASKQLLKTSLNHHQTAHFIFLSLYFVLPFQLEKKLVLEMLSKHYSYIIAYCQYMHKLIMASETCRSTITLIETRFNF